MLKRRSKVQQKLAKVVMGALLLSGVLPGMVGPAVAHAQVAETGEIAGTVSKTGGQTVTFTAEDIETYGVWYGYACGNRIYDSKTGAAGSSAVIVIGSDTDLTTVTADGYTMTVTKDTFNNTSITGAMAYGGAKDNVVIYSASDKSYDGGYYGYSYAADVVGGVAGAGNADTNTVTIEAGMIHKAVGGSVISGGVGPGLGSTDSTAAATGDAINNTVNVNGGTVLNAIGGQVGSGYALRAIAADEESGTAAAGGNANGNHVNVNGGSVAVVAGGTTLDFGYYYYPYIPYGASDGTANNNTVTITDGTVGITETSEYEDVDGNPVTESYKMAGMVYGGLSKTEASGNKVTVKGGNVDGALIFGGLVYQQRGKVTISDLDAGADSVNTSAKADNNTVNILASSNPAGLFGGITGFNEDYSFKYGSGNTLNIAAKDVTAYAVGGFDNMNFYLPEGIANGDTMLTIKTPKTMEEVMSYGSYYVWELIAPAKYEVSEEGDYVDDDGNIIAKAKPTDLTGVTFGVAALSGVNLEVGNTVNLIVDENGLKTDDALKTADSKELGKAEFLSANNMSTDDSYGMSISKQGANAIIATVESKTSLNNEDRYKSAAETRESVVTLVNTAADLLAGQGLSNASDAAGAAGGRMEPFAAIGGSNLRAESGSHVTTKGFGLNLGFAKEIKNKSGKLLIGPMVEYGHGRYDSYQDDGTKADGKSHYWGIGVLAKQTNNNGLYYEGSLRVGRTGSDYTRNVDANLPNYHADYDSKSTYWGAHLGIGKVMDIGHKNTLDYYGKYFYSHTGGDTTTMHTNVFGDVETRFDSVNSHRLRLGARVTHALNEKNKFYGGLAWQYEFNGDAKVSYSTGGAAPSPSVKGSSGMIELGWQVKPGKSPMVIDLGVTGWVGKQRGVTANLQANWTF